VAAVETRSDAGEAVVTESERVELLRLRRVNTDLKLDRTFLESVHLLRPGSIGYERPRSN